MHNQEDSLPPEPCGTLGTITRDCNYTIPNEKTSMDVSEATYNRSPTSTQNSSDSSFLPQGEVMGFNQTQLMQFIQYQIQASMNNYMCHLFPTAGWTTVQTPQY